MLVLDEADEMLNKGMSHKSLDFLLTLFLLFTCSRPRVETCREYERSGYQQKAPCPGGCCEREPRAPCSSHRVGGGRKGGVGVRLVSARTMVSAALPLVCLGSA